MDDKGNKEPRPLDMTRGALTTVPLLGGTFITDRVEREFYEEAPVTLERTILLIVGLIVLASVLLAVYHSSAWLWLTGLMGVHLVQASITGFCPVVIALKRMGVPSKAGFA